MRLKVLLEAGFEVDKRRTAGLRRPLQNGVSLQPSL